MVRARQARHVSAPAGGTCPTPGTFSRLPKRAARSNAGVADDAIDDIKRLTTPVAFRGTQDQRAVYAHALELTAPPNRISDATHRAALEAVGSEAALVDLVCTIGLYMQVAFLLNAFQVPMPPHVTPPFPEPDA